MPRQLSENEYSPIATHGPKAEYLPKELIADLQAVVSIPLSSNHTSILFSADGYYDIVVAVKSTQAGAINLLRFVDDAGTIPLETSPPTIALVANTQGVLIVNDGKPFASFQVQVTNSSGTTAATLSSIGALMSAH